MEVPVDLEKLEALGQYAPSDREIAAQLGLTEHEVAIRRQRDPDFRAALDRGEAKRNLLLRQAEMKKALKGDAAALARLIGDPLKTEGERRLAEYLAKRAKHGQTA